MKRFCILFLLLFLGLISFAQQKTATVRLKNGTTLIGTITELNPVSHIVISIAGFESKINMSDIESISDLPQDVDAKNSSDNTILEADEDFPETFTINIGPYEIEMILVKGAMFSMGFDGSGSRIMDSEPIHDVTLSSFYVNAKPLSKDIVTFLKKGKVKRNSSSAYQPDGRSDAHSIVGLLAEQTNLPLDVITEAQWEYVATNKQGVFYNREIVFCRDFYSGYPKEAQTNPIGPSSGKYSVVRQMSDDTNVYARISSNKHPLLSLATIRFTMPATAVSDKNQ